MKYDSGRLLLVVDIAGTFLFGMEGAAVDAAGNASVTQKVEFFHQSR